MLHQQEARRSDDEYSGVVPYNIICSLTSIVANREGLTSDIREESHQSQPKGT